MARCSRCRRRASRPVSAPEATPCWMRASCRCWRASTWGVAGAGAWARAPAAAVASRVAKQGGAQCHGRPRWACVGDRCSTRRSGRDCARTGGEAVQRPVKRGQRPCGRVARPPPYNRSSLPAQVPPMISREPTLERLAIAQALMLEPFGLDDAALTRALATIREHRVDDADLYFETTRHEGWSLEEGIVKSGSFSIDQGVGVRAVAGERTAFAYSDDLSEASLMDAARTVRTIAAAGQDRRVKLAGAEDRRQPRAVCADGPDRHAGQHAEGGAAGAGGEAGPRQGPAHRAGDGRPGRRIRRGAGRARRRHARRRRAPAGAPERDRDRRAGRPPRGGQRRVAAAASAWATSPTP
jgi:hypothetical protein